MESPSHFLFDSHSHVYETEFDGDREDVLQRAKDNGISTILMPATDMECIRKAITVQKDFPESTLMAFGLHPESVDESYEQKLDEVYQYLKRYKANPALVAVGEIGLDYYWDDTYRKEQIQALEKQFDWAIEFNLPVILHTRNAHREMVETVAQYVPKGLRGVFHSFTGSSQELEELLQFEQFLIGINGIATFKKSESLREALHKVPLNRLLLETDAPYLAPVPKRGKRNEPAFLRYTAEAIASELALPLEELAQHTCYNAKKLFCR